ncbi:MAG: hypothetical protein GY754_40465, partial [bacterium]|nr:hypothetical protein [bacterium]
MRKVKQKSIILTLFSLFLMLILMPGKVEAALTSVNISALPTLNNMSDSRGYFLASGATYTYTVDISFVNPGATVQADFDYISVNIPTATGNILATWDTDGGGTGATPAGAAAVSGALATGSWSNGTARLTITFYWPAESSINASRTITATVSDGTVTMTDTSNLSYGIASSVRVLSFTNNGIASDNRIIPDDRSGAFTVTGRLIYDLPGYAAETVADVVADADITSSTLQLRNRDDDVLAWAGGTDTDNDMSFSVAAAQAFTARAQGYYWQVEVDFAGASSGANETSPSDNRVTLEVNYVVV